MDREQQVPITPALGRWLRASTNADGPFSLQPLAGGNSNETLLVQSGSDEWVLRRPPRLSIAAGANNLAREHRVIAAVYTAGVRVPRPIAFASGETTNSDSNADAAELGPLFLMERIDGVSITDELPSGYPDADTSAASFGNELVDHLARLHAVDWTAAGLSDFGRPEQYLERQLQRLAQRYQSQKVRELPHFDALTDWLVQHLPPEHAPAVIHGDYHLDNTLFSPREPRLEAIIDFELSTIGDPLVDVGLLLAFWGPQRPSIPAMPHVQAVTRTPGAPTRRSLAERYAAASERDTSHVAWYAAFAFWKLASIVEGAYAQFLRGETDTEYARNLEHDVPRLVSEAWELRAGL
jgi:aminoglycoside phosphotransferase (APT) family kinase protein